MKAVHFVMNVALITLFVLAWVFVPELFIFDPSAIVAWHIFMSAIAIGEFVILALHTTRIDRIIVIVYLGDAYACYSRLGKGRAGLFDSGIAWVFPYPLNQAVYLPTTQFTSPFTTTQANTLADENYPSAPNSIYLEITSAMSDNPKGMQMLFTKIPLHRGPGGYRKDLAVPHEVQYLERFNTTTGAPEYKPYDVPCIAHIFSEELEPAVSEAANRTLPTVTQKQALDNDPIIEVRLMLNLVGTIFEEAGLLQFTFVNGVRDKKTLWEKLEEESKKTTDRRHIEDFVRADIGPALTLFDFNVKLVFPADPEVAKAMSAEAKAKLLAKARIADAEGEREALELIGQGQAAFAKELAAQAGTPAGRYAIAAETLQKLPQGTILTAGGDVVGSLASKLLKGSK